ncbi:MAG: hypothetical protein Q9181_002550 [Wetmoreana brouardii]
MNQEPMVLYAASRKGQDLGLKSASAKTQLKYPKLDIADPSSIESFANMVKEEHQKVDVLINNAGVNLDQEYSPANVKATIDTNYRGTLNQAWSYCQRIINRFLPQRLQQRDPRTLQELKDDIGKFGTDDE